MLDHPPKKGAYRVRSDRGDDKYHNAGWRYWTGERWLPLVHSGSHAWGMGKHHRINPYRNTPTKFPILWEQKS